MSESEVLISPRAGAKCPPDGEYELTLVSAEYIAPPWAESPEDRKVKVTFSLSYPLEDDPENYDGMLLHHWYSPIFGRSKKATTPMPHLYKLLCVLSGKDYEQPTVSFSPVKEVEQFKGRSCLQDIVKNDAGYPRFDGMARPVRKTPPKLKASVLPATPTQDADDVDASVTGAAA